MIPNYVFFPAQFQGKQKQRHCQDALESQRLAAEHRRFEDFLDGERRLASVVAFFCLKFCEVLQLILHKV